VYGTAPLRRFGASTLGRLAVLATGLAAMAAYTIPDLANTASGWLRGCLWCCLLYFVVEGFVRAKAAAQAGALRGYLLSASGLVDLLAVFPVPLALVLGLGPATTTTWMTGLSTSPRKP